MNYETAKERFEEEIRRQKRELLKYCEGDNPWQVKVNAWTASINAMIDYINIANVRIEEMDDRILNLCMELSKMQTTLEKVSLFAKLHRVNPALVSHYTVEELKQLLANGIIFQTPVKDFINGDSELSPMEIVSRDAMLYSVSQKYFTLKQLYRG